jgi:hercynylcysteine S-oxide lyase
MQKRREYQDMTEAQPDVFMRVQLLQLLDESREAMAKFVNAPLESIVFVTNATEGINTVLRNLVWEEGDVIISFSTIYDACARAEDFVADYFEGQLTIKDIQLDYPLEDSEILSIFKDTVKQIEAEGRRARLALFDTVSSNPGLAFPWIDMVAACRELGVLSLIDGAHGVGMIPLDLSAVDPDFFVSNCHKWLYTPRGSAVFYVPVRNQALLPTTLSTARGYRPRTTGRGGRTQPLPGGDAKGKNDFVRAYEWTGTRDDSPTLCVKDAIAWRRDVLGGEERIRGYLWDLNKRGIARVSEILGGTEVLENKAGTLTNCALANVALPIRLEGSGEPAEGETVVPKDEAWDAFNFMHHALLDEFKTYMAIYVSQGRFWVRMSAQVYLDIHDYEWGGRTLKELSDRVARGEFRKK